MSSQQLASSTSRWMFCKMSEDLEEVCSKCGHKRGEHAEYVDNSHASTTYVPERRQCLHGSHVKSNTTIFACDCLYFRSKKNGSS